ncbi:APC family permease [Conexibacter sp. CPCC 206217]|uniref:APC family permease n=1 Tax=Conexibacter sp. CPCC 206217 TaxID=3064574 RepID=UPI00271C5B14|nr:APC family permease [Conexibacter sp. CPCC 206217]MDO8210188.1 APC family permease [Conexibacter sp. CPCC 206217]
MSPADPADGPAPSLYERKATGLVRSISLRSSVFFNVTTVGVMWSVLALTQIAGAFSDANPLVTAVIACVLCLFPVLLYGVFTAAIPRSGGDYVWVGRTFHPWVGLAVNANATTWFVLANGFLAFLVAQDALPTAFATLGTAFGSDTIAGWSVTISQKGWTFAIGVAVLLGAGLLAATVSMRRAMKVNAVFFFVTVAGLLVAILALLFSDRGDFVSGVAQAGGSYDAIVAAGQAAGFGSGDYSLWASLLAIPPLYLALAYTVAGAYTGGEVRTPRRTGILGPLIASLLVGAMVIVAFALCSRVIGFEFIGSASHLSGSGDPGYTLGQGASFFYFVTLVTHSKIVLTILAIAYFAAPISTILATALFATRNLFAWSFDRMLPEKVAEVSPRTGTPVVTPIIVTVVSILYLIFLVWGSPTFSAAFGAIILGTTISFIVTAIAAIAFPFRRRSLYASSAVRGKIAGLPAITLVGGFALAVYLFVFYSLVSQDALGVNNSTGFIATAIVLTISLVFYPIAYAINKSRGVDLALVGRELPPE